MDIRYVALYLRKSRGEEEKDLEKHQYILREMCTKNKWKYVEYIEIASSENIEFRPKFKQLLNDVESGIYDAVLVVDYQRLGRGELEDQGIIKRIFRDSNTYIVTPDKIYNLVDDTDDLLVDVRGLLARQEYKSITKNLLRGKKIGSRLGNWTNGPAPFPYDYVAAKKGLEVNPNKLVIYREMKEKSLSGISFRRIAWDFNNRGILGPTGGLWHDNTVRRIMLDETHLGRIISNKTQGSGHKNKKTKELLYHSREDWVVIENCHEALKTIEEHEKLRMAFEANKIIPHRAKAGVYALSGIVFCGNCKKTMRYNVRTDGHKTTAFKACSKYDLFGNYCGNRGLSVAEITKALYFEISNLENKLLDSENYKNVDQHARLEKSLLEKEQYHEKLKKALLKIKEMYELDEYTSEEYEERKTKRQKEIITVEDEIKSIRLQINYEDRKNNEERISTINTFKEIWNSDSASENDKNAIAKRLISRIEYIFDHQNSVEIDIQFR